MGQEACEASASVANNMRMIPGKSIAAVGQLPAQDLLRLMIDLSLSWDRWNAMATYIVLINFTEQGIRNIKDSPRRAAAATELARDFDIEIRDIFGRSAPSMARS
jgi:hypothetical protein